MTCLRRSNCPHFPAPLYRDLYIGVGGSEKFLPLVANGSQLGWAEHRCARLNQLAIRATSSNLPAPKTPDTALKGIGHLAGRGGYRLAQGQDGRRVARVVEVDASDLRRVRAMAARSGHWPPATTTGHRLSGQHSRSHGHRVSGGLCGVAALEQVQERRRTGRRAAARGQDGRTTCLTSSTRTALSRCAEVFFPADGCSELRLGKTMGDQIISTKLKSPILNDFFDQKHLINDQFCFR